MKKTKNVIFDLGGVLLNLDFNKTFASFYQIGFSNFEAMFSQFTANDLFKQLETGKISTATFYDELISLKPHLSKPEIAKAWNAMLLDFRLPSIEFLKTIANNHQIFLLSNTNAIHYDAFTTAFNDTFGAGHFDDFFTKAYYSHLIHLRKPDEAIFKFVLQDAGINAEETLFIDDTYNNIDAAANLGFKTHLLVPGETIENLDYGE
jgi:putative hydrolase of the HAD superfamily